MTGAHARARFAVLVVALWVVAAVAVGWAVYCWSL